MEAHFTPEQENRITAALQSGAYRSPDDVIDRALEVLWEHDDWLDANREAIDAKINRGLAQLKNGQGIPEDRLLDYLEDLKAKAK